MRSAPSCALTSLLLLATAAPLVAMPRLHRGPTSPKLFKTHSKSAPRSAAKAAAPTGIAPERATQIQTALIQSGYMTGQPSGVWDAPTQAAMEKLQADNGWQTKLVPDARAIIKLGLGPGANPAAESNASEAALPAAQEDRHSASR
jgi:peptidoglycan hydrolase-like protein with peptidoglycan-binding domain